MSKELRIGHNAVSFGERLASSGSFKTLFAEGMGLVEETAAYLDGDGREEARRLPRTAALTYASESMRLTTRLMQIASWLLLQRAVNEGEMTQAEASSDKRRSRLAWQQAPRDDAPAGESLPSRLLALIEESLRLQERIVHLDKLLRAPEGTVVPLFAPRPIEAQMSRLRDAFGG